MRNRALAYGVGIYRKHRLEPQTRAVWETVLYWTCWILLLALLIAVALQEQLMRTANPIHTGTALAVTVAVGYTTCTLRSGPGLTPLRPS